MKSDKTHSYYYTEFEVPGYIFNKNPKKEEGGFSIFACRVLRSEFPFFFSSRKRQRDKDSILWDDGLYMEPSFTKLDPDGDSALSTYNPIYNLNGGKLEIDSTQAH